MNKSKAKSNYTYSELIKNYYGVSSPNSMFDINRFEGLIAEYYGRAREQVPKKPKNLSPAVISLSFDQSEILIQPASRRHEEEYIVQSSAEDAAFEEYVLDADQLSSMSCMTGEEIALPLGEPSPDQECLLDVLQPLKEISDSPSIREEIIPAPIAAGSVDEKPMQQPFTQQPAPPPPVETHQATEADFIEDLQSILTGQKVFDPVSKQTVEKEKLGGSPSTANQSNGSVRPIPDAKNEQEIFDRIAQSMQYANTFDLGSVDLEKKFSTFDEIYDLQQKVSEYKKRQDKPTPAEKPSPALRVDSTDFIQDLDAIRNQNPVTSVPLEEPAVSFLDPLNGGGMNTNIPEIEELNLAETAGRAAYALKQKHPSIVFTSGRRNKQQQAHAMAANVVLNRKWIEQTYVRSGVRDECQKWVDENPDKKTKEEIEEGLLEVLNKYTDSELGVLSKHISGMAFDVQPVEDGNDIKESIKALPGLHKFLEKEGGLVRWHAQFK